MDAAKAVVDEIIGAGLLTAEAVAQDLRDAIKKLLVSNSEAGKSQTETISDVRKILQQHEPAMAMAISNTQIAGWIAGIKAVGDQIPKQLIEDVAAILQPIMPSPAQIITTPTSTIGPPEIVFPPGPPDLKGKTLIRLPAIDAALEDLAERKLVTRPQFDAMSHQAKSEAFTIAYEESIETIGRVRDLLHQNIMEGQTRKQFEKRVEEEIGQSAIGPAHLETIYRVNVQTAYSKGQEQMAKNPVVSSVLPYARYDPIDDGRVRPEHLALGAFSEELGIGPLGLDGTNVYRADDPMWQIFTPPWSWNCRCSRTYLTIRQAARKGVQEAKKWMETGEPPANPEYRIHAIPFAGDPTFTPLQQVS